MWCGRRRDSEVVCGVGGGIVGCGVGGGGAVVWEEEGQWCERRRGSGVGGGGAVVWEEGQ